MIAEPTSCDLNRVSAGDDAALEAYARSLLMHPAESSTGNSGTTRRRALKPNATPIAAPSSEAAELQGRHASVFRDFHTVSFRRGGDFSALAAFVRQRHNNEGDTTHE